MFEINKKTNSKEMPISEYFKEFVAYYVEGAILNGESVSRQKYLQRYCAIENCEYAALQENLTLLVDALNEYKVKKSKVFLKMAKYQARFCYLPDNYIEDLLDKILMWEIRSTTYSSYMKNRGGDIFNDMPGGKMLKKNDYQDRVN